MLLQKLIGPIVWRVRERKAKKRKEALRFHEADSVDWFVNDRFEMYLKILIIFQKSMLPLKNLVEFCKYNCWPFLNQSGPLWGALCADQHRCMPHAFHSFTCWSSGPTHLTVLGISTRSPMHLENYGIGCKHSLYVC